jgi:hypothetical protein
MNGGEALGNKRDGSVFVFIEVQCADETARLVSRFDLDLNITLHVSPSRKFRRFVAIRFAFFGCTTCSAGCTNPYLQDQRTETSKGEPVTAEYERENLIVFGEEDPMSGTHTKPARTRQIHHLLEP